MPILELRDLTYTYGARSSNPVTAVDGVNLAIGAGEIIGIIGQTGSGKSTLVQQCNGLLRPTRGQVLLHGKDIWAQPKKIRDVRFQVGMVFQYPEYQLFAETVEKDIAFGPQNRKLPEQQVRTQVRAAMEFVGLDTALGQKSPFSLSGGEKRRAAIAGVVAMDPDVLILDEPTAGLDPQGRNHLLDQILQYHKTRQNTILLVSHSMEDIAKLADRVLVMHQGKAVLFDTTAKVFAQSDALAAMGLRVPQVTRIMALLAEKGWPVDRGSLTIEQAAASVLSVLRGEVRS